MKSVLFVRSGNNGEDPISTRQAKSLYPFLNVDFYDVVGRGFLGYLKNIGRLRRKIKESNPDVIHCHYSFTGILVSLTFTRKPIIVSLMGSDIYSSSFLFKSVILFFSKFIWNSTIVKSNDLKAKLNYSKVHVIPNGVDLDSFYPLDKLQARKELGWDLHKYQILFGSSPNRKEKNFPLAKEAIQLLEEKGINFELKFLDNVKETELNRYYSACDVLLLTSRYEGSPNVIKEAVSCNCPFVATNVGDIYELFGDLSGSYICNDFSSKLIADNLMKVLSQKSAILSRSKITDLEISSKQIALKLVSIYKLSLGIRENKVLIVCSGNKTDFSIEKDQVFIYEQVNSIKQVDTRLDFDYYIIKGKGIFGYLSNLKDFKKKCYFGNYKLVHAHYVHSGLFANLQRKIPVVTTFHGSDINNFSNKIISFFVQLLSRKTIYVSKRLLNNSIYINPSKTCVIPCGVDLTLFESMDSSEARKKLGLKLQGNYILFSSSFNYKVKNYSLLKDAIELLHRDDIEVIELKGYSRNEVSLLLNAVDVCVMTSIKEGSPQIIKEALATNCRIVSTDVGDVKELTNGLNGCYIINSDKRTLANCLEKVFESKFRLSNGRNRILHLGLENIANRILGVYNEIKA